MINNDALKTGIVVCFMTILFLFSLPLYGCDMSVFVQSDFAARCQLLIDLGEKAMIAKQVGHPDTQKHSGNLSREWVRFFLAHGAATTRPPSLAFIASSTWEASIREIGMSIAATTRGEIDPASYEIMRFRIGLLKDAQGLEQVQKSLLATSSFETGSSSVAWLEHELLGPGAVIAEHLQANQTLLARLESMAALHLSTAEKIDQMAASESAEIVAAFSDSFKKSVREDLRFWQQLFFCEKSM